MALIDVKIAVKIVYDHPNRTPQIRVRTVTEDLFFFIPLSKHMLLRRFFLTTKTHHVKMMDKKIIAILC